METKYKVRKQNGKWGIPDSIPFTHDEPEKAIEELIYFLRHNLSKDDHRKFLGSEESKLTKEDIDKIEKDLLAPFLPIPEPIKIHINGKKFTLENKPTTLRELLSQLSYDKEIPFDHFHIFEWNDSQEKFRVYEDKQLTLTEDLCLFINYTPQFEPIPNDPFNSQYLQSIGFRVVKDDGQCGKAVFMRSQMTQIWWNRNGHSVTYFGETLDKNYSFGIMKDGGTRTAFQGYIFSKEQIVELLNLTW